MNRRCLLALFLLYTLTAVSLPSHAVEPGEVLADPALETRARNLSQHLRCVVCQNQSIDDSNAPLARDLRLIVRERLTAGDSDDAALDYIVSRYGNFVLLKPPVQINTLLLWFGPVIIFALALLGYWTLIHRRPRKGTGEGPANLTSAEREQLQSILKESPTS